MSLQSSTFNTSHVMDNEIIKANDFEFAFEQLITNVSRATQMFLESNQDFVINGKVLPDSGMNLKVSPIYGVCKSTGIPFGRTETTDETIGFSGSSSGRIDILEVKGDWQNYDNQQRAFNDPDTDTQTYQYVDTKKLMKPVYQIIEGVEGSGVAPESSAGWVKLAEISIRAGATSILESDIHNITADVAGLDNDDWTTEKDATYNIGYISDVNARFRVQHNEDGTHADDCINQDSLDIGTGAKQINANVLPIGGAVSIPTQTIAATDPILSVITKAASIITSLYNAYLLFNGAYKFNGELSISAIADPDTKVLTNPLKLVAAGDGTAELKIGNSTVFSIDSNGKLSTNGYTASSANNIVTKAVTDAISSALSSLTTRVENIENTSDVTVYANGTLSSGTNGSDGTDSRYNVDSVVIYAATTQNITLSGSQSIDGTTPENGSFILVKNQTNAKENGIYQYVSNAVWQRHNDYLSPNALKAKLFNVTNGTNNGGKMFYLPKVNFTDGSDFGTDDILFAEYFGSIAAKGNKLVMRRSDGGINGNVTGNLTGNVTGNLTGNVTGNLTGDVNGNVSGNVTGNVTGNCSGSSGSCTGNAATATTASDSSKLNGYVSDTSATANTIVRRNGSGYMFATYFNQNSNSETPNSSARIIYENGSDGYFRKSTIAKMKEAMSLNNVNNTADANKSVNYATSAGSATSATNSDKVDGYHVSTAAGTTKNDSLNSLVPVSKQYWTSTSGYIVYANGLKIVWGKVNLKNYNTDTQTLSLFTAVSFTQKPTVIITIDTSGFVDYSSYFMQVHNISTTGFQIRRPDTNNTWELNYIAIGY